MRVVAINGFGAARVTRYRYRGIKIPNHYPNTARQAGSTRVNSRA
jgi:hypothetical protein